MTDSHPLPVCLDVPYSEHWDQIRDTVAHYAKSHGVPVSSIRAWPMKRVGRSPRRQQGAPPGGEPTDENTPPKTRPAVYRVRFLAGSTEDPRTLFLKVPDPPRDAQCAGYLRDEFRNYEKFIDGVQLRNVAHAHLFDGANPCLCYIGAGAPHLDSTAQPLSALLEQWAIDHTSRVCGIIYKLFKDQEVWRALPKEVQPASRRIDDEYSWYLRWNSTEPFLMDWIGEERRQVIGNLLRESGLQCPWALVERIQTQQLSCKINRRPVHGDLHQHNIIIELNEKEPIPWLIDFEWTERRHALIDFALLEVSLRLRFFARFFGESEFLSLLDSQHHGDGPGTIEGHRAASSVYELCEMIREFAKKEVESKDKWPGEYYLSCLMITMGQLSLPECPARHAYLTAAWMAANIDESIFATG